MLQAASGGDDFWYRTKGRHLFVRATSAGGRVSASAILAVTDPPDRRHELAAADIVITKDAFHPWTPWLEFGEKPAFPDEGIATPSFPMTDSLDFVEAGKSRTGRLPTFWPADDAAKMTMGASISTAFARGRRPVGDASSSLRSHSSIGYFIARWWINGKPFQASRILDTGSGYHSIRPAHLSSRRKSGVDFDFRCRSAR